MYSNFAFNQVVTIWPAIGLVPPDPNPQYGDPVVTACRYERRGEVRLDNNGTMYLTGDIFWCGVNLHDMVSDDADHLPRFMLGDNTEMSPYDAILMQTVESVPDIEGFTRMWRGNA